MLLLSRRLPGPGDRDVGGGQQEAQPEQLAREEGLPGQ